TTNLVAYQARLAALQADLDVRVAAEIALGQQKTMLDKERAELEVSAVRLVAAQEAAEAARAAAIEAERKAQEAAEAARAAAIEAERKAADGKKAAEAELAEIQLSLSRLNHPLPRPQTHPKIM